MLAAIDFPLSTTHVTVAASCVGQEPTCVPPTLTLPPTHVLVPTEGGVGRSTSIVCPAVSAPVGDVAKPIAYVVRALGGGGRRVDRDA